MPILFEEYCIFKLTTTLWVFQQVETTRQDAQSSDSSSEEEAPVKPDNSYSGPPASGSLPGQAFPRANSSLHQGRYLIKHGCVSHGVPFLFGDSVIFPEG